MRVTVYTSQSQLNGLTEMTDHDFFSRYLMSFLYKAEAKIKMILTAWFSVSVKGAI